MHHITAVFDVCYSLARFVCMCTAEHYFTLDLSSQQHHAVADKVPAICFWCVVGAHVTS